jgi:GNAT superfamily N-acetyltransferase
MALWDIYLTPSTWSRPEISWLSGHERENAEALITPLWDAREKFWLNQKYMYCHLVAVHPDYQRKGIGQLLMEYGISIAQEVELPMYVESSPDGVRLYEKMKCQRLIIDSNPPKGLGTTGTTERRSAEGNPELALFVHVPRGAEGKVPAAIKFR